MRWIVLLLVVAFAIPAEAQTTRHYNERGQFVGRSETRGTDTRRYNERGQFVGRSETRGGETRFYDTRGRFIGSSRSGR